MPFTEMLVGLAAACLAVGLSIEMHFLALRWMAWAVQHRVPRLRRPMFVVLASIFVLHLAEVLVFAVLLAAIEMSGFGHLKGATYGGAGWFVDHFYFSIASYTTLGLGDIVPHGAIRMVAGIEALAGLVLVTWSASFTYLMMERLWADRLPSRSDETDE